MGLYTNPTFRQLLYLEAEDRYLEIKDPLAVDPLKQDGWMVVTRNAFHEGRFKAKTANPVPQGLV